MPNGRLSKCVLGGRKSADLYQNTSGNAASVSLFANAISTDTNSEMTVVVGIASTTLSKFTTVINSSAGTFCSMTTPLYYTECFATGSGTTFFGHIKPQTYEYNQPSNACFNDNLQVASLPVFEDTYGCRINEQPDETHRATQGCLCMCSNACIWGKLYGGNEMQNPAIWMRQYPSHYHTCCGGDWYWAGKFIGVIYNTCSGCCWTPCSADRAMAGTWYPITARNVGMGNSTNARQNAMQAMINWCCQCGCLGDASVDNGMAPITVFSGCNSNHGCKCRWGSHCNLQWCRMCACHCCTGGGMKMWNWYALDRDFQCCNLNYTGSDYACNCWCSPINCAPIIEEGKLTSPPWMTVMWCCNCACGCAMYGGIRSWYTPSPQVCCGCTMWQEWCSIQISSCCNRANWLCQNIKCWCHPCCSNFMAPPNTNGGVCRMSPYGFAFGMTNCSMMIYGGNTTTDSVLCHRYIISYPALCYFKCCYSGVADYHYQRYRLWIAAPLNGQYHCYEFPVKYLAWNCFKENKCETMGCTYMMIRSQFAEQCGIFSLDANDMRISHGPFCNYSTAADHCCGTIQPETCFRPDGIRTNDNTTIQGGATAVGAKLTKVANFPTDMACTHYADGATKIMCTSCLFRSDFCTWNISLYNHECNRWDGFQTSDLINWTKVSDPYSTKVSNVLTTFVSSDYACIVDDCNCYFANIDCTGIIDYKLNVNQYERTGIVLSDGDRIMVQNDADVCLSFQVWGYEG